MKKAHPNKAMGDFAGSRHDIASKPITTQICHKRHQAFLRPIASAHGKLTRSTNGAHRNFKQYGNVTAANKPTFFKSSPDSLAHSINKPPIRLSGACDEIPNPKKGVIFRLNHISETTYPTTLISTFTVPSPISKLSPEETAAKDTFFANTCSFI